MRPIVAALLVLAGVLGSGIAPGWNQAAAAEEERGGPGMGRHRMFPEMLRETFQGLEMPGPWLYGRGGHGGPLISLMLAWKDQLGLAPEQEHSLKELRSNHEKEAITRTSEIEVAELELKGLLEQEKVDVVKVEAQVKKVALLRADRRLARIKTIEAGKAVLTPAQQETFKRLVHDSWMGGMGPGMMRPGMRSVPSRTW
jgi:Spy/CpxP family protein refolding chaperone